MRTLISPYTHHARQTSWIMLKVLLAMLPGVLAQCYYFGYAVLIQLALAVMTGTVAEALSVRLRQRSIKTTLGDNSALLTAALLGVSIPPTAAWWVAVVGVLFAIVIVKQLYGGLGENIFNPAMAGYVMLLISFPLQMTGWLPPETLSLNAAGFSDAFSLIFHGSTSTGLSLQQLQSGIDGISQATPLDHVKTGLRSQQQLASLLAPSPYHGVLAGAGWQWINVGYLMGGLIMLFTSTIRWQIPFSFLGTLTLISLLGGCLSPNTQLTPLYHLFSGATMLGAFFILTDPVTASTTRRGRLIYGALIGLLVWFIRVLGGYPDGVAFAVLLANLCVPLIDHYTPPQARR